MLLKSVPDRLPDVELLRFGDRRNFTSLDLAEPECELICLLAKQHVHLVKFRTGRLSQQRYVDNVKQDLKAS